jgi:SH3-like domain-containing protein
VIKRLLFVSIFLILSSFWLQSVNAAKKLNLPRFASLRANTVNVRVGPGKRYPIEWVFIRPQLPVEIIRVFNTWRMIRDSEGVGGWVHQSMISGLRTVIVIGSDLCPLHQGPSKDSRVIARIENGSIGQLAGFKNNWCHIKLRSYKGWIELENVWGLSCSERKS